jgi:hypothetical protein
MADLCNEMMSLAMAHDVLHFDLSGPWQVHLYAETSRSQTIIVLRFHSGGLDRPSAYVVVQQFFTALNAIVDGQTVRLPQNPGKDAILPTIEDLVPKGKSSKGFFQKGFDTVGYALSANKYALLPFQPSYGEQRKEPFKSDILTYTLGKAGMMHQMLSLPVSAIMQ